MRRPKGARRTGLWFAALVLVLAPATSGCAQSRPCMIIPAQIELAKAKRDSAKEKYDRRLEEITRSLNNLEASRARLERLQVERDELRQLVPAAEGGQ
jgi:hypothetical protein